MTGKKLLTPALCVLLTIAMLFQMPGTVLAASTQEQVRYLSDIRLFYVSENDKNASNTAKKECEAQGYNLLNVDLNKGTSMDYVYIGYKTTTDRDKAITDIRMLGMNTGYYLYDYRQILDYLVKSNAGTGIKLYDAAQLFAQNCKAGSPRASDAREALNLFYVGSESAKLGDYIVAGKADVEFFTQLVIMASIGTVNAVMTFLNAGAAAYNGENWADLLEADPLWETVNGQLSASDRNELHKQYNDDAKALFVRIQEFASAFENAKARNPNYREGSLDELIDSGSFVSYEDEVAKMKDLGIEDCDVVYLATHELFNRYRVSGGEKLGDWLVRMGRYTSEKVNILQLYPVVHAMGSVQVSLACSLGMVGAASNLGPNEKSPELLSMIEKVKKVIKGYNDKDCLSVWENADDDLANAHIAYTSEAIRKSGAENSIGRKTKGEIQQETIDEVMQWVNLVSGAAMVVCMTAQLAFTAAASIATACAAASTAAVCTSIAAGLAACSTFLCLVGVELLIITVKMMIIEWIAQMYAKFHPEINHSTFPEYVFDAADTPDGVITVKYKCVRDENGSVGDVNARRQSNWAVLAYTTDPDVGSPIRADKDGNIFKVLNGNSAMQNGYDCVNLFGERSPANLNYKTSFDRVNGIYLSYRTERSIENEGIVVSGNGSGQKIETLNAKNYIADIIVVTAGDPTAAKAKITKKSGKYYLVDYNLSPHTGVATYVGYSLTTDPNEAVTDLRIAPYHGNDNLMYGDSQYIFVGHVGADIPAEASTIVGDALMKTHDPKAGSPIPADGIHFVTDLKDLEAGWEPVTLFCGMPYDFNTKLEGWEDWGENRAISGYSTDDSDDWSHKSVYMCFEPSVKYVGGEKYLSGIYFINGYDIEKTISQYWSQTKANMNQLKNRIKEYPNATVCDINISGWIECTMASGHNYLSEYLCYAWTYNPKRAIYDIVAWQGDTYNDTLSYTVSKPNGDTGNAVNYAACSMISQQNIDMSISSAVSRYISSRNAVLDSRGGLLSYFDTDQIGGSNSIMNGYTKTLPSGFSFAWDKTRFIPLGLYVAGPSEGKTPLGMNDVIITGNRHDGVEKDGLITSDVKGEKTLADKDATGAFRSIYEIKDPNATEALNISYPVWYNSNGRGYKEEPLYIYLRGSKKAKKQYISAVSVGSFSKEQYRKNLEKLKDKVSDKEVNAINSSVNAIAMLGAASSAADEMICYNIGCEQKDAWYNRKSGGKSSQSAPDGVPAAYIGVTRTDNPRDAITGVLLYQNDSPFTAARVRIGGADYYCDSTNAPIIMNGKQYFLYYTKNIGVLNGTPVEEIFIDGEPLAEGWMTALNGGTGTDSTYRNPDIGNFIHLKCGTYENGFYTSLFIGAGRDSRDALCDLVDQECGQYIDLDLNIGTGGNSVYLGYETGHITPDMDEDDIEDALSEAVWDIVITKNLPYQADGFINDRNGIYYVPVSDVDLNSRAYGSPRADELYMYYCSPYTSAMFNRRQKKLKTGIVTVLPETVFSSPLSKLVFAMNDRVPYNDSVIQTNATAVFIKPWEYVMLSDHSVPADLTSGSHEIGPGGYVADNRIRMFAQRVDGSVKDAGEITGGFVSETMNVGLLYIKSMTHD